MAVRFVTAVAVLVLAIAARSSCSEAAAAGPSTNPDAGADAGNADTGGPPTTKPPQPPPAIRITGTAVLADDVARAAAGPPPESGQDVTVWGEAAAERIAEAYRARGYTYARVWFSARKQPGVLWFDVDEGRVRVTFVGLSSISATLFRLRLNLPGGVFQKPDFERSLDEQKRAMKLTNAYYRVHEQEGYEMTVFGQVVPARTLEIHVFRRESFGLALDIGVSAAWGVVPSLRYSAADVLWPDDRLLVRLDTAVPYRRYIFDASPQVTWVHGGVDASYRLPHFGFRTTEFLGLAPRVDSATYVSQYARADLQLSSFYLLRDVTVGNLVLSWADVELSLGLGADLARVFLAEAAAGAPGEGPPSTPADVYSARALVRANAKWTSALPWTRRDRRTFANLLVDLCLPGELRATLWGQHLTVWGRHRLFLRVRGIGLAGAVPFWDDVELAGSYQRVFFGDLYWAHGAVQVEIAYHIKLWRDWFELGIFHDLTAFEDRISSPPTLRLMDAFGPSLHFLILDQYALSVHQGIGFAPGKLSQTLSFTVESVF